MERKAFPNAVLMLFFALLVSLALASRASAFIYWADTQNQTIGRAANDGTEVNDAFIHTGELPFAVAVDADHIYWANQNGNSIGRANIDGSGVDNSFISGVTEPDGIAVNGSSIFWSTIPGPIGRADLSGSNVKKSFIIGASEPCGLAVDSGHLYWADDALSEAKVGRSSLDGLFVQPEYVKIGVAFPCGVAVNAANIYWADTGFFGGGTRIGRADIATGKSVDPSFIAGAATPCGLAADSSSHLYWANAETGTIGRANTDGTGVNESFVTTGNQPCGVAVDSLSSPPPSPPPAGGSGSSGGGGSGGGGGTDVTPPTATISKGPGLKLAQGKAKFSFRSSEAGSHFQCKLDKPRPKPCTSPKTYKSLKPGAHIFKVWAIDGAGNKSASPAKLRFKVPA
jgi:sugar lactone lactonase YvrE